MENKPVLAKFDDKGNLTHITVFKKDGSLDIYTGMRRVNREEMQRIMQVENEVVSE